MVWSMAKEKKLMRKLIKYITKVSGSLIKKVEKDWNIFLTMHFIKENILMEWKMDVENMCILMAVFMRGNFIMIWEKGKDN